MSRALLSQTFAYVPGELGNRPVGSSHERGTVPRLFSGPLALSRQRQGPPEVARPVMTAGD